jgi:hypothetical protein
MRLKFGKGSIRVDTILGCDVPYRVSAPHGIQAEPVNDAAPDGRVIEGVALRGVPGQRTFRGRDGRQQASRCR